MKLVMSAKERHRLAVIRAVAAKQLTQRQAAEQLGICERQVRRSLQRRRIEGDAGLVHRARNRPSNRRVPPPISEQATGLLRDHYHDFGPTLAAEKLRERHGIALSTESVRQLMIEAQLHRPKPRKLKQRSHRPRRPCCGELLQVDGCAHDWFEGRAPAPALLNIIDDATGRIFPRFVPAESSAAVMALLRDYIRAHGRPLALYADLHSIYRTTRSATVEEQLEGEEAQTQVGRALCELDIEYIPAYSPQAKGRVERGFGTLQDRLVKELRLAGICDLDGANRFLRDHFIDDCNRRFAVPPTCPHDAHRSAEDFDLDAILSHQELRTVTNDYTISYYSTRYQIARESVLAGLRGGKVIVEARLDGTIRVRFRDRYLTATALPPQPQAAANERRPAPQAHREPTVVIPAADHPWRRDYRNLRDGPIYP